MQSSYLCCMFKEYDIIVVGAGHAGSEAAAAAANMGASTLLITMDLNKTAQMSCNPAMGGIAKGQILREIDALGGYSGIVADKSTIQFRMLNKSKGPAMWSPRSQNDRMLFSQSWRHLLEQTPNLDFYQDMVLGLLEEKGEIKGVVTQLNHKIRAKAVILTNGTFLNGMIHIGDKHYGGGRVGDRASVGITANLEALGFRSDRLKTGTPPRIDGRSLNYSKFEVQNGDEKIPGFSFKKGHTIDPKNQKVCWITYTNPEVHQILKSGFDQSPMYQGRIKGNGPRYCPSIEDKVSRFAKRERHQMFIEPEGWNTIEIYANGFSTSLPEEIQYKALQKVPGFENCKFFRPGYAIEYDYFPPTQLSFSLETKLIENLYLAGQINGTTGYEEAACQGLIAGINASLKLQNKKPLVLKRNQAYIGVLIDDLINKGTKEPYRMFTSRAEYRTLLRQDNADLRLTALSYQLGLADKDRFQKVLDKKNIIEANKKQLDNISIAPEEVEGLLKKKKSAPLKQKVKATKILLRPQITLNDLKNAVPRLKKAFENQTLEVLEETEIQLKYKTYIRKEQEMVERMANIEELEIPENFNYDKLQSLSAEAKQKFNEIRPGTIGQASRISGVRQSDVQVLTIFMGR